MPDPSLLVNERSGVVLRTITKAHHPSVPKSLVTVQAHIAQMAWAYPHWQNDIVSGGSAFGDGVAARNAALGEAAERYCGNYPAGAKPILSTFAALQARGEVAVDPQELVLFSERMYATPGCPFVPFTRNTETYWVRGWSLTRRCAAWLPMSMVYINHRNGEYDDAPLTHSPLYVGIAAGATLEQALVSGIEEWIERDSTMAWWLNAPVFPAIQLTPPLAALWAGLPTDLGQRAWLIALPNEFEIPVLAGVVYNSDDALFTIGFACRPDPVQAGLKAWSEALILQEGSRDLLDPNGAMAQAIHTGYMASDTFFPYRADRCYLEDMQGDFRDVTHLLLQQQLFLDPRAIERVRPWVAVSVGTTFADLPRLPERTLAVYQSRIEAQGYEIFAADVTTPDVAYAGLSVVRVLIPRLIPNFPAAFPPLGRGRVQEVAVKLGWRPTPLDESELNYFPMPHA